MPPRKTLKALAREHGTPVFVVDHQVLRRNLATFTRCLPRVQPYYAVKANPDRAIIKTLYDAGASFDVASMPEFLIVYENIKSLSAQARRDFIWNKVIYANPIKSIETLAELDPYRPLVTYDNLEEVRKIARHAPHAGLALRIRVPNTGAMVELSSKFGAKPVSEARARTFVLTQYGREPCNASLKYWFKLAPASAMNHKRTPSAASMDQ